VDGDEHLLTASKYTATPPTTTKGNYFSFKNLNNDEKTKGYRIFCKIFAI
jgi:hypothetical protein